MALVNDHAWSVPSVPLNVAAGSGVLPAVEPAESIPVAVDAPAKPPAPERVRLFGVSIDPLTMPQAVERIASWLDAEPQGCRYVVTPNVDHVVMLESHAGLQAAYADASLVLADGMPVVWGSRLVGRPLPERVTGSDLVPALFDTAAKRGGLRVFLLGAAPGVAERAAHNMAQRWPAVNVVDCYSPPLGFERDPAQNSEICRRVRDARPDIIVLGLGAPKQELWAHAWQHELGPTVVLCVGATIDFLAGQRSRAPAWMQRNGLEWCYRLASEPRRLAKRYLHDGLIFPRLLLAEWLRGR